MKNRLKIFSDEKIYNFLKMLFSDYEIKLMRLKDVERNKQSADPNIVIIRNDKDLNLINFKNLNDNFLVITHMNINLLSFEDNLMQIKTPLSIKQLKNKVEHFVQNLRVKFHDISIDNDKIINLENNSFCYLTKIEYEILRYLIIEKQTNKNFIKENILNIKSNIETNSLESHLTRIRKKMNIVRTAVKIQTKNENLLITV